MTKYIAKIDDEIFCDEDKYERDIEDNVIGCDEDCEECVKQYFEREAEEVQSMTKEIQNILKKDLKKYQQLVEYADEENEEIYRQVANCIQEILEEGNR